MESTFPERLSALRRERNINQRTAAADLNISQALLSHYENGAREPGLKFVCRACDYYGVSADYLLCRTESTDPAKGVADTAAEILDGMQALIEKARQEIIKLSTEEDQI